MNPSSTETSGAYLRALRILHLALLGGQVIFLLIAAALVLMSGPLAPYLTDILLWMRLIAAGLAVIGIGAGQALFIAKTRSLQPKPAGQEKFNGYRSALLIRYALLEGPSLTAVVFFILTGDYILLGVAVVLIALFVAARPSRTAMEQQLQLPYEERILLDDPDAPLY